MNFSHFKQNNLTTIVLGCAISHYPVEEIGPLKS